MLIIGQMYTWYKPGIQVVIDCTRAVSYCYAWYMPGVLPLGECAHISPCSILLSLLLCSGLLYYHMHYTTCIPDDLYYTLYIRYYIYSLYSSVL